MAVEQELHRGMRVPLDPVAGSAHSILAAYWSSAWVTVEDTNWVYLQSADTLHYQTGQTLALEIMSGGFVAKAPSRSTCLVGLLP